MENILTRLIKEANKPKHAPVRKLCQEALGEFFCSAVAAVKKMRHTGRSSPRSDFHFIQTKRMGNIENVSSCHLQLVDCLVVGFGLRSV